MKLVFSAHCQPVLYRMFVTMYVMYVCMYVFTRHPVIGIHDRSQKTTMLCSRITIRVGVILSDYGAPKSFKVDAVIRTPAKYCTPREY